MNFLQRLTVLAPDNFDYRRELLEELGVAKIAD
jgi:hypothetical protein